MGRNSERLWEESLQGGTSRAIYSAFTEGLGQGADPYSGGGPQLVGLHRIGPGIRFGTIYGGKRYLAGACVTQAAARTENVKWFNESNGLTVPVVDACHKLSVIPLVDLSALIHL